MQTLELGGDSHAERKLSAEVPGAAAPSVIREPPGLMWLLFSEVPALRAAVQPEHSHRRSHCGPPPLASALRGKETVRGRSMVCARTGVSVGDSVGKTSDGGHRQWGRAWRRNESSMWWWFRLNKEKLAENHNCFITWRKAKLTFMNPVIPS